jgi:Ca-activated chloride channel family protein
MAELFGKLENPAMTDIAATVEDAKSEDIQPNPVPDLYAGEPVLITAEIAGKPAGRLMIMGKTGDQPWRVEMNVADAAEGHGISKLWARRKIDGLEAEGWRYADPAVRDAEIEKLALAHHLVSRVTSLVAVDVTPSRPSGEALDSTKLPLNLPEGWDFEKVFGQDLPDGLPAREREAMQTRLDQYAANTATLMAAAPTARAAGVVAAQAKAVDLPGAATLADLEIWIGLALLTLALGGWIVVVRASRKPVPARIRT